MDIYKNFETSFLNYETKYKSKHWKKFDLRSDLFKEKYLANFRNNSLSDGLDDRYSEEEQKKIFEDLTNEIGEKYILDNLLDTNIGNSKYFFKYKNKFVDGGQNFHIKWLYDIEKLVNEKKKIFNVCEIGGGYGSFGQKIIRRFKCKYLSIDLPEANLLSSFYLKNHFKDSNFIGNNELKNNTLDLKTFEKNDIFIINPWNKVENIKFDLIINTRSMMEMDKSIIGEYFDFIHDHIDEDGFFLNINRYRKKSVGYPIHFFEYPYDNNWTVVKSKRSWRQNWVHFLLVQRKNNNNYHSKKNNIQNELQKIKYITIFFIVDELIRELYRFLINKIKKMLKIILRLK